MMTKKKDAPEMTLDEDAQAGPAEPHPTEGFAAQNDPAAKSPTPAASETAPLGPTPDRSGDGGVGTVATDATSLHDAEVQAIVEQALADQQDRHDEELRAVTNAKRGADVPGRPETTPIAMGSRVRIKVMAVALGYYDHKRMRPGDVFWIKNEAAFSDVNRRDGRPPGWMRKVSLAMPERVTSSSQALRAEHGRLREEKSGQAALDKPTGGVDVMGTERR